MDIEPKSDQIIKRPEVLKILCILSFIGSGLSAFSNLVIYFSYDQLDVIMEGFMARFPELETILAGGKRFFLAGFVLYTLSFFGVSKMWNLKKAGFHFYVASQSFILLLPVVTLESFQVPLLSILITVAFVLAYSSQIKFMS